MESRKHMPSTNQNSVLLNQPETQSAYMQPPMTIFARIGNCSDSRGEVQKIQSCIRKDVPPEMPV
jgi:hypothetical protein